MKPSQQAQYYNYSANKWQHDNNHKVTEHKRLHSKGHPILQIEALGRADRSTVAAAVEHLPCRGIHISSGTTEEVTQSISTWNSLNLADVLTWCLVFFRAKAQQCLYPCFKLVLEKYRNFMQEPTEKQHGNDWLCTGCCVHGWRECEGWAKSQLLVSDGRNS